MRYKQPVLAFTENLEKEILVDAQANLGDKSRYHTSVVAQIVNGKFGAHLPYYRLQDIFASSGWTPNRSTLDYVTDLVHEVTQDLPKLMLEELIPDRWRANHPEAVREYREQERRDKADVASLQAAKRRARSELRKKK